MKKYQKITTGLVLLASLLLFAGCGTENKESTQKESRTLTCLLYTSDAADE